MDLEQQQDIAAEGFRVFHFSVNEEEAMSSVFETVQLFLEPEILPGVTRAAAQRNIKFLRDYYRVKKGTKVGSSRLSRASRQAMDQLFPRQMAHAVTNGWSVSTHFARVLYANFSYEIFIESYKRITGKSIGIDRWIQMLLGHMGSMKTALSYRTLEILPSIEKQTLKYPPDQLLHEFKLRLDSQAKEIKDLKLQLSTILGRQERGLTVVSINGVDIEAPQKSMKPYDKLDFIVKQLDEKSVKSSLRNLKQFGFGQKTITQYKKWVANGRPDDGPPAAAQIVGVRRKPVVPDAPASSGRQTELPLGAKVLTGKGPTDNAAKQQVRRAVDAFGAENVIDITETGNVNDYCDNVVRGHVIKRRKVDLCLDGTV